MEIPAGRTGTWITNSNRTLGEERLGRHMHLSGMVAAMHQALTVSIYTTPLLSWNDDALEAMKTDADDLVRAAQEYAAFARSLADDWRAQRTEQEVDG